MLKSIANVGLFSFFGTNNYVIYLMFIFLRAIWSAEKFVTYVGLDQPPVEPSSADTCGINRSHVRQPLHFLHEHETLSVIGFFSVLKHS